MSCTQMVQWHNCKAHGPRHPEPPNLPQGKQGEEGCKVPCCSAVKMHWRDPRRRAVPSLKRKTSPLFLSPMQPPALKVWEALVQKPCPFLPCSVAKMWSPAFLPHCYD